MSLILIIILQSLKVTALLFVCLFVYFIYSIYLFYLCMYAVAVTYTTNPNANDDIKKHTKRRNRKQKSPPTISHKVGVVQIDKSCPGAVRKWNMQVHCMYQTHLPTLESHCPVFLSPLEQACQRTHPHLCVDKESRRHQQLIRAAVGTVLCSSQSSALTRVK